MNPLLIKDYLELIIQHISLNDLHSLLLTCQSTRNIIGLSNVWKKHYEGIDLINYIKPQKIYQDLIELPECEFTGKIQSYYGDQYYLFRLLKWSKCFTLKHDTLYSIVIIDPVLINILYLLRQYNTAKIYQRFLNYDRSGIIAHNLSINMFTETYQQFRKYVYLYFHHTSSHHNVIIKFNNEIYKFIFKIIKSFHHTKIDLIILNKINGTLYVGDGCSRAIREISQKMNLSSEIFLDLLFSFASHKKLDYYDHIDRMIEQFS
jgi:hypothetical protein